MAVVAKKVNDERQTKLQCKDAISANNVCSLLFWAAIFNDSTILLSTVEALFNAVKTFNWDDIKLYQIMSR